MQLLADLIMIHTPSSGIREANIWSVFFFTSCIACITCVFALIIAFIWQLGGSPKQTHKEALNLLFAFAETNKIRHVQTRGK